MSFPIKIGEMNTRIGVATRSAVTNSTTGEVTDSYGTTSYIWAKVQEGSGLEGLKDRKEYNKEEIALITYKKSAITEQTRVIYDGKNWDIVSIEGIDKFFQIIRIRYAK